MSSSIWTQCEGAEHVAALAANVVRIVESQHLISTRRLVDSDREQELLEELLEQSKPPLPKATDGLHWLLATPFRYPPLRHGSRFATKQERGVFYASESLRTAFAEAAYYRLVFLAGTKADLAPLTMELTSFWAGVRASSGVDLSKEPFSRHRGELASKSTYGATQSLGTAMRTAEVQAFRFVSARDEEGGTNVGVFDPKAIRRAPPKEVRHWSAFVSNEVVEIRSKHPNQPETWVYRAEGFCVDGHLPMPAP